VGDGVLHLHRADVRAVVDDDLLVAAVEPEVAVVVGVGEIAGVEPAVTKDLGGGIRTVPVPDRLAAGPDPHPPDGAGCTLGAVVVAHRDPEAADRPPDRSGLDGTTRRVERGDAHLGHAVALVDGEPDEMLELPLELERHLVGAGPTDPEG